MLNVHFFIFILKDLMRGKNKTLEEVIKIAKEIHGDKYDYSITEYKGSKKNMSIICKKHGCFEQRASSHLKGNGCPQCGG